MLANIDGFDVRGYIQRLNTSNFPVVGLPILGGGTQSGIGGLGIWQAFDASNPAAVTARTGGLTQVLTYITGLSGGGALTVSTLAANEFIAIDALRKQINFTVDYTLGPDGDQTAYLTEIFENLGAKAETGLPVSVADAFAQNTSECIQGFDKFTFIQGSTANAFNAYITPPPQFEDDGRVILVNQTAQFFNQTFNESLWATYPNPFENYSPSMQGVDELLLIDGSLGGETGPIRPLIIPERQSAAQGNIPFPRISDVATLVTQNLIKQPTFFGCDAATSPPTPLGLYLPNSPWSGYINFTFFKWSFTDNEFDLTADNAFNLATYGNGTVDPSWPACLACTTVRGSLTRLGIELPEKCQECFRHHCWNGNVATRTVTPEDLNPSLRLNSSLSYAEWNQTYWNSQTSTGGSSGGNGGSGGGSGGEGGAPPSSSPNRSGASTTAEIGRVAAAVTVASIITLIALF
ncbi:lysophosphoplipase a [Colletotrichum incanum]|uniref:Lysophospholipase n=1 Tax=Colletotrichum incanum TaxID=1573173 RepID=A0A162PXV2_COLIC|nr:lysophosphoplipase a [Colletotrichum incanum]